MARNDGAGPVGAPDAATNAGTPMRTKEPITIAQVARHAAVSPATVSKALHGHEDIAEKTRRRVLATARRLDYQAPTQKRERRLMNRRVGLVSFGLSREAAFGHYPYARLMKGIQEEVRSGKGELVLDLECSGTPPCCRNHTVAGVLVVGPIDDPSVLDTMAGIPAVTTPDPVELPGLCSVNQDNSGGTALVTRRLIAEGHVRIVFAAHTATRPVFMERAAGYYRAMLEAGLEPSALRFDTPATECGPRMAGQILESGQTAIVAANDNLATILVARLADLGVAVPADLSIVGFDHWPQPGLWPAMPLTTVDSGMEELGRQAVRLLSSRISASPDAPPVRMTVDPVVVDGNSVAPPRTDVP